MNVPSIAEAQASFASGEFSPIELMEETLARIDQGAGLGAFIHVDREGALTQAKAVGKLKRRPPLYGIPVCVKDVIDVAGMPTTAGSASWSRMPMKDAAAVERLRAAGAIFVGKANTNEFAYGIDGLNPHWGGVGNPVDPARLAGGSSSGSAAAVGAGMALGGLGTDTSGSIRVPASLCGLVGLRPTLGLVPIGGVIPLAKSYDAVGPMARSVADTAILMAALLGTEAPDPMIAEGDVNGLRIALSEDLLERVGEGVASQVELAAKALEAKGAVVTRIRVPAFKGVGGVHRVIQEYEAAQVHRDWFETLKGEYEEPVRARLEAGRKITSTEYRIAQDERSGMIDAFVESMEGHDVLLAPSTPITAPRKDEDTVTIRGVEQSMRAALLSCTVPLTQLGWPVVSVPIGKVNGLPSGLQILGRENTESLLLKVAAAVERSMSI